MFKDNNRILSRSHWNCTECKIGKTKWSRFVLLIRTNTLFPSFTRLVFLRAKRQKWGLVCLQCRERWWGIRSSLCTFSSATLSSACNTQRVISVSLTLWHSGLWVHTGDTFHKIFIWSHGISGIPLYHTEHMHRLWLLFSILYDCNVKIWSNLKTDILFNLFISWSPNWFKSLLHFWVWKKL